MNLETYFKSWVTIVLFTFVLSIFKRNQILLLSKKYFYFLFVKWKIIVFLLALFIISGVGLLWLDPTWDLGISIIMSILTYFTAPYSVGIFYRFIKWIERKNIELFLAIILTFFSASWFYDGYNYLYLLWFYPNTWFSNILYSIPVYLLWWIIWNLDYSKEKGAYLSFYNKKWTLEPENKSIKPFLLYIVLSGSILVWTFGYFIYLMNLK